MTFPLYRASWLVACLLVMLLIAATVQALPSRTYPYQGCFEIAAQMHSVPIELLLAVAATESNWEADARSHANAHGIMQIQWPGTARHLGVKRVSELYNPCLNISLGARYLRELLDQFDGPRRALAAYNYGPTRIKAATTLPAGALAYVEKVLAHQRRIVDGMLPARLEPSAQKTLVTFDSHSRASKLAQTLTKRLQGATVEVQRVKRPVRGSAVVLAVGQGGLTVQDRIVLTNMGWTF